MEGEAIVVHPRENRVYVLNPTASAAWHLADGTRTTSQISAAVTRRFGADTGRVAADLARLWLALCERDLLELLAAPADEPAGGHPSDERAIPSTRYAVPVIESEEVLEILAAVCSSVRTNDPVFSCMSFGSCQIPFQ